MMQFLKENNLLTYDLGPGVEAFSTERDAALPYPVIQGHQVHGSRVAVVDRPGMTREELEGYDAFVTDLPGVAIGVRTAGIDTYTTEAFFSARREGTACGRIINAIKLS